MDNVTHVALLVKPFLGSNRPWERRTTVWATDFAGRREAPPPSTVVSCRTDGHRVTERFTPRDLAVRTLSRYLLRRPLQSRSMPTRHDPARGRVSPCRPCRCAHRIARVTQRRTLIAG